MFLEVLCLIWCAVFAIWWYIKPRPLSPPEFPGALPIIGHGLVLLRGSLTLWQAEKMLYDFCLENGGVVMIHMGLHPNYVITDLEDSLTVANTCLDKPYVYNFGKDLYARGLVTANGMIWKSHRKLLNPAFNQRILNSFIQEYCVQARRLVSELAHEVEKDSFDVIPYLVDNVLQTVFKTTVGGDATDHEQEVNLKTYAHATESYFSLLEDRLKAVWLHLPLFFNMTSLKKKQEEYIKTIKSITEPIVARRKSDLKQKEYSNYMEEDSQGYKTLLDRLLDEGAKEETFTDEEIREHLDTVVAAAYDTSISAMTFCLITIGSYPDVQAKIYEELQKVFGDSDGDLSRHDLPKLVYLEAVLKESLRLNPSVPRIGRYSESPVKLKNYTVPAGSMFWLSLYGMNRHPMWGADVNEFKPERWLDPATLPVNPNAFGSFSLGKRNCIGKQYAVMAIKTTLAYILRQYHITGDITNVQCKCDLILKPISGHHIKLKLRT